MISPPMKTSDAGRRAIEQREGCVLHAYQDSVGVWTIGYGDTANVFPGLQITQEEADERLTDRLAREFEAVINANVDVPLTQNQFDALVSFAYNVGTGAFKSSTLLRLLNAGKPADVVAAQFDRWHSPPEIIGRRNAEKAQFLASVPVVQEDPVRRIQRKVGVTVDGQIGPQTIAAIAAALGV